MLTRHRAFAGETANAILAGVLKVEPDWNRLPPETPESLRRLLRRCLQKDRKERLQHIGDARIEIGEAQAGVPAESRPVENTSRLKERVAWISALALIAAAAILWSFRPIQPAPEARVEIVTPPTSNPFSMEISPDGRKIVFEASSAGRSQLWLRSLDSDSPPQALPETDGGGYPFWSPDSRSVGFFAGSKLKKINIAGGSPQILAGASDGAGGTWNREGVILFVPIVGPVFRVSEMGGDPVAVTQVSAPQYGHFFPRFLPDGRHFLYYATAPGVGTVYVGQLDGSESRRLFDADTAALYSAGHLLFGLRGMIFAQVFNPDGMMLSGNPFPVAGPVVVGQGGAAALSVSAAGPIAYRGGLAGSNLRQFQWLDRSGNKIKDVGEPTLNVGSPEISHDERHLAVHREVKGNGDIWILDTSRGTYNQLTENPAVDAFPVWSPNGDQIVFWSGRKGKNGGLYRRSAAGGGNEEPLQQEGVPVDWSLDGRFLLCRSIAANGSWDIFALPLDGERKPLPVIGTNADERDGQFSPDTRWIAYQSNRTGRFEIYIQPFPGPGNFTLISSNGGAQVRWRRNGKELFYVALDGMMMSVPIQLSSDGKTIDPGAPVSLFSTRIGGALQSINKQQYAVSNDGQRFLMNTVAEESNTSPIKIILNWKAKP
jgi:Tol biopolymer transport system component